MNCKEATVNNKWNSECNIRHSECKVPRISDKNNIYSFAFTLAEVLITLGIIGIVAALTLPNLIKTTQEYQLKKAWKKAYSNIQNAYSITKMKNINVCTDNPFGYYYCGFNTEFADDFLTNFKVSEKSSVTTIKYKNFGGMITDIGEMNGGRKVVLIDGMQMFLGQAWPAWNILVDVNGEKKPNQIGKDMFGVEVRQEWLKPIGAKGTQGADYPTWGVSSCSDNSTYGGSRFVYLSGAGCSAKYLYE